MECGPRGDPNSFAGVDPMDANIGSFGGVRCTASSRLQDDELRCCLGDKRIFTYKLVVDM
jgi:hypothetical protein